MDINMISTRGAVLVVLALLAIALAIGLANAPANRAANRWLALFLLVLAGLALEYTIDLSRPDRSWRWLRHLPLGLSLALGPMIYGYIHRLTLGRNPPRFWLHFLAAGFQAFYLAGLFLAPEPWRSVLTDGRGHDPIGPLLQLVFPVSLAVYAIADLRLMARYRHWAVQARSDADQFAARWVRNVLVTLLITLAGEAVIRGAVLSGRRVDVFDVYPFYVWLLVVGAYLGVEGRRYLERPFPAMSAALATQAVPAVPVKDWHALAAEWQTRTWEAGWWREPNLTLAELARRLGVNTGYLSRAINEGLGHNFSDMINRMRAEAVAARLEQDAERPDLLEIALDAGFGSKSSFNRAFRARYGVTPSAYRPEPGARS